MMRTPNPAGAAATIERLVGLPDRAALELSIEQIFFEAAARRSFSSEAERAEFRERWLGRYLEQDDHLTYVALDPSSAVLGYVVGSHVDPARSPRFLDIPYFAQLAAVTARFPGHLHINLTERARNQGLGGKLVQAFLDDARKERLPGVHVVTGAASRNVAFYKRLGFLERATATYAGNPVVLLGREL